VQEINDGTCGVERRVEVEAEPVEDSFDEPGFSGWNAFVDRIRGLLASEVDEDATHKAVYWPLGGVTRPEFDEQLEIRRRALRDVRLAQRATPADEVIQQMAGLLVELVKLTPAGFQALAEEDPDSALRLLAEANDHVESVVQRNEASGPPAGVGVHQGLDRIQRVEPDELLGGRDDV
tara:strand:- start:739 stop:1272 length:534 start_codon:yes stop_codon:yes gene_type:complete